MEVLNAYEMGQAMNLNTMQQEAYIMATLETSKVQTDSSLDRIYNDVVFNGKEITPTFFSMLLNMVRIKNDKFAQIVKILCHACTVMHQNSPGLVRKFFQSEGFYNQFVNINMIVDELWMLRKEYPDQLQEWKLKHRQIFQFRSKLLKALEKQFGRNWVQALIERAEMQRVRVWPLEAGVGGN